MSAEERIMMIEQEVDLDDAVTEVVTLSRLTISMMAVSGILCSVFLLRSIR